MSMDLSIVVPLFNEEESLTELCEWINRVMSLGSGQRWGYGYMWWVWDAPNSPAWD